MSIRSRRRIRFLSAIALMIVFDDLAGGHSVPEVNYDSFADGRFEVFGLIIDFDPHAANKNAKLCHFMASVQCPGVRQAGNNKGGAAEYSASCPTTSVIAKKFVPICRARHLNNDSPALSFGFRAILTPISGRMILLSVEPVLLRLHPTCPRQADEQQPSSSGTRSTQIIAQHKLSSR
jgi:hypothetical protein